MLISDDELRAKDSLIVHLERQIKELRHTQRDDFAKAALIGLGHYMTGSDAKLIARRAFEIADAMMVVRNG